MRRKTTSNDKTKTKFVFQIFQNVVVSDFTNWNCHFNYLVGDSSKRITCDSVSRQLIRCVFSLLGPRQTLSRQESD